LRPDVKKEKPGPWTTFVYIVTAVLYCIRKKC